MLPLLALHCGDYPFWCSASSSCLLGWKWGQCRLAKSVAACHLCVSRLCLLFFFFFLNLFHLLRCLSSVPLTEQLLEFMHQLPAFANMTMSVRRELCAVMVFAVVERAGTIVLNDGEEVCDGVYSWTHKPPLVTRLAFNSVSGNLCVSLWEPKPFTPVDLFFFYLMFFFCSIKPERQTTLITRPLGNKSRHYLFSLSLVKTPHEIQWRQFAWLLLWCSQTIKSRLCLEGRITLVNVWSERIPGSLSVSLLSV